MDESERSYYDRLSRDVTGLLKTISAGEDVDPVLIVMACEFNPPSIGEWYDEVLRSMQYTTPVACRPWNRMNAGLVRSTANEICSLLLRSFYLKLMPDSPVFLGPSDPPERLAEKANAYVAANEESFWQRFDQICASANFPQWSIVVSMADTERATMSQSKVPVTAKAYSSWRKTSEIRKYLGKGGVPMSPTTWQRHRKELRDEIVDHPTSGAQKVKFTRIAAEALHINATAIEFKVSDESPESLQ